MCRPAVIGAIALAAGWFLAGVSAAPSGQTVESCFLLYDEQTGATTREPSAACSTRATPASTFKIPHALAALDARAIASAYESFRYDGSTAPFERWRRDHDLSSAMRDSVVWYFQRIAERMGIDKERAYLKTFDYGNQDASGPLTWFWLGSSLQISPEEQLTFLRRFFGGQLPVRDDAMRAVRQILVQPAGRVVNAAGEHAMADPWPSGTTVYAKTGRAADRDRPVAWLVGRVERGSQSWLFVSCVLGSDDPLVAVKLAGERLKQLKVL